MAIDIRAEVSCSLGELISGSFADDYLQGSGLIKTRGEVVLVGTQTPAVGTLVTFSYDKAGTTHQLPRVLRVLSSFADPFRRTTTVQLGCKLTYLENRKPPVKDPNSKEENASVPCYVYNAATLPISAAYVMQQCLTALGLSAATVPLTNKFSVEEFPLEDGYINVISDLLLSEGYVGYLDTSEVLQFIDLSQESGPGPLLTRQEILDLGPIGVGELPGESVLVRYDSQRLLSPEELSADEYLKRSWEVDENFGDSEEITVTYQLENGESVTLLDTFSPYQFTATRYDVWDRKIESISYTNLSSANINGRWAADAARLGHFWNRAVQQITLETVSYKIYAPPANNVNLSDLIYNGLTVGPTQIKAQLYAAGLLDTASAAGCIEDPPEGYDEILLQKTTTYASELELAGALNIDSYVSTGNNSSLVTFSTTASLKESEVEITFERDNASGYTKTVRGNKVVRLNTPSGQQDLATRIQDVDTAQLQSALLDLLDEGTQLVAYGGSTNTNTQKEFGLQRRPSQVQRNNSGNSKPVVTEQKAEIQWVLGSTTSTAVTEFSLPYAPDDEISWSQATGYTSTPSDAPQKALRYGRIQNRLLLGNRNGVSLQLAPDSLPVRPFDLLYVEAEGLTGAYRVNGSSWAFDANGIVASTDALLWGVVSAEPGTDLSASWVPLAPGTTALPTPYTPVNGVLTPDVILTPYGETVPLLGLSRSSAAVVTYGYGLDRGTETQVAVTRTKVLVGSKVNGEAGGFDVSGLAGGFVYSRKLLGAVGAFGLTGSGAGNVRTYGIGTNAGAFTLTGNSAGLLYGRSAVLDAGSYGLQGQDAGAVIGIRFSASSGSFALTGQTATSLRSYVVSGAAGSFTLIGQAATLTLPPPTDPYASSVVLLLHMDGANNSTTFADSSLSARTLTALGNAKISTAQSKFGGASGLFDGSGDYLSISDSSDFDFGSGDFTIECWFYRPSNTFVNFQDILTQRNQDSSNYAFSFYIRPQDNTIAFRYSTSGNGSTGTVGANNNFTITNSVWHHFAITRSSGTFRLFVNGTVVTTSTPATNPTFFNSTAAITVGAAANGTQSINGYLDDVRVTKGVARYTADFTPPTAAFPNP